MPEVDGCPTILAENAIRQAAIEFCRDSRSQQTTITQAVTAGTAAYTLTPPVDTVIQHTLEVWHDGTRLTPKTLLELDSRLPRDWRNIQAPVANWYSVPSAGSVQLVYTPSANGSLSALVTLKPSQASTTIDDRVAEDHREAIAAGAKYRLLSMSGKPWANPALSLKYKTEFSKAISHAHVRAYRNNTGGILTANQVEFGR